MLAERNGKLVELKKWQATGCSIMTSHLIGCVCDVEGDALNVSISNGYVMITYNDDGDITLYNAQCARALAAILHAAVDVIDKGEQ